MLIPDFVLLHLLVQFYLKGGEWNFLQSVGLILSILEACFLPRMLRRMGKLYVVYES